jgi:hypothetical protein
MALHSSHSSGKRWYCPVCGKRILERKDGTLRAHGPRGGRITGSCGGSYRDGVTTPPDIDLMQRLEDSLKGLRS